MKKLILCRGIQGSGKTTYAKNWVLEDPTNRIRINWDDLRNMFGKYWVPSREPIVKNASLFILEDSMNKELDIIIDNMNLSAQSTNDFKLLAFKHGYQIEYVDFKTSLDECIERDSKRENPIGESVIRSTYQKYKSFYESK